MPGWVCPFVSTVMKMELPKTEGEFLIMICVADINSRVAIRRGQRIVGKMYSQNIWSWASLLTRWGKLIFWMTVHSGIQNNFGLPSKQLILLHYADLRLHGSPTACSYSGLPNIDKPNYNWAVSVMAGNFSMWPAITDSVNVILKFTYLDGLRNTTACWNR